MGEHIPFYTPDSHKPKTKWIPPEERGKVLEMNQAARDSHFVKETVKKIEKGQRPRGVAAGMRIRSAEKEAEETGPTVPEYVAALYRMLNEHREEIPAELSERISATLGELIKHPWDKQAGVQRLQKTRLKELLDEAHKQIGA